ncbi:MAG: hypothetical protein ACLPY5_06330 [Candidatus Bathyarchaeia archaeon]
MGFEIHGCSPKGPRGDGSSLNPRFWDTYLDLLKRTNVFQPDELETLRYNSDPRDDFKISETKALAAASKLRTMDCYRNGDVFKGPGKRRILHELDVQELVAFLETCGGFRIL